MNKLRQDTKIGENIRRIRKMRNMTQEEVIAKLQVLGFDDINRSLYSRYETGELNIKVSHLRALKELFRCSYEELFDMDVFNSMKEML